MQRIEHLRALRARSWWIAGAALALPWVAPPASAQDYGERMGWAEYAYDPREDLREEEWYELGDWFDDDQGGVDHDSDWWRGTASGYGHDHRDDDGHGYGYGDPWTTEPGWQGGGGWGGERGDDRNGFDAYGYGQYGVDAYGYADYGYGGDTAYGRYYEWQPTAEEWDAAQGWHQDEYDYGYERSLGLDEGRSYTWNRDAQQWERDGASFGQEARRSTPRDFNTRGYGNRGFDERGLGGQDWNNERYGAAAGPSGDARSGPSFGWRRPRGR